MIPTSLAAAVAGIPAVLTDWKGLATPASGTPVLAGCGRVDALFGCEPVPLAGIGSMSRCAAPDHEHMSHDLPAQYCPAERTLADLVLMADGVIAPVFEPPGGYVVLDAGGVTATQLELVDPEGVPVARVEVAGNDGTHVWGPVTLLARSEYGAFRHLRLGPAQLEEQYRGWATVPVSGPLTSTDLDTIRALNGSVVLLVLCDPGTVRTVSAVGLVRATRVAAELLGNAVVVTVTVVSRGDPEADRLFRERVVTAYAPGQVHRVAGKGGLPPTIAEVVESDRPPPHRRGLVLFLTGLSGSGKSTLARALHDRLLEQGRRKVTSLDGDIVRRTLSAGLTFSRRDREVNIYRIGWVAAEISRHGGVAICSPIAPFEQTRRQVRGMVAEAGGAFFLVHVATSLEECERRDRKGLYAKARRGEIPDFTGISSPYEEPLDPDVRVDTAGRTIEEAAETVLEALESAGYLERGTPASALRKQV